MNKIIHYILKLHYIVVLQAPRALMTLIIYSEQMKLPWFCYALYEEIVNVLHTSTLIKVTFNNLISTTSDMFISIHLHLHSHTTFWSLYRLYFSSVMRLLTLLTLIKPICHKGKDVISVRRVKMRNQDFIESFMSCLS